MARHGVVHVIGDSHASFATGLHGLAPLFPARAPAAVPGLRAARLGPFLAHSLTAPRHPVRRLIRAALRDAAPRDPVLLCFGEIDCRCHLVPVAQRSRRAIERIAAETARAYARSAPTLLPGRPLAFLAATPTPSNPVPNPDFPTRGTLPQRRRATRAFNRALRRAAAELGLPVRPLDNPGDDFDAAVVSSDAHEDALALRARRTLPGRVPVVRIYRWAA